MGLQQMTDGMAPKSMERLKATKLEGAGDMLQQQGCESLFHSKQVSGILGPPHGTPALTTRTNSRVRKEVARRTRQGTNSYLEHVLPMCQTPHTYVTVCLV